MQFQICFELIPDNKWSLATITIMINITEENVKTEKDERRFLNQLLKSNNLSGRIFGWLRQRLCCILKKFI